MQSVDNEVAEVKQLFATHSRAILRLFDYYCLLNDNYGRSAYAIQVCALSQNKCGKYPDVNCALAHPLAPTRQPR